MKAKLRSKSYIDDSLNKEEKLFLESRKIIYLIIFRNFDAQLTDNEFFNQFIRSLGRELIIKSLSFYEISQIANNKFFYQFANSIERDIKVKAISNYCKQHTKELQSMTNKELITKSLFDYFEQNPNEILSITNNHFFYQFITSIGRKPIITSLFYYCKKNPNEISSITNIQIDILKNRHENIRILKYDCIDKLPNDLISECASFVRYKQYFRFAKCNRKTYIGCLSIPKIQNCRISITTFGHVSYRKPDSFNLYPFKNVRYLLLNIEEFNRLSQSNQVLWLHNNSLQSLTVMHIPYAYRQYNYNDEIMEFIKNKHLIDCKNIKKLSFRFLNSSLLYQLLSQFQGNIQYLQFDSVSDTKDFSEINENDIKEWFPEVQKLEFKETQSTLMDIMLIALHNQLKTLSFDSVPTYYYDISSHIKFPKLEALHLYYQASVNILKISQNLKCIRIECAPIDEYDYRDDTKIDDFIEYVISKQLSVQHISIYLESMDSVRIMRIIESSFHQNPKRKCKNICIQIRFGLYDQYDGKINLFVSQIIRVIHKLKVLNVNTWSLKIEHLEMCNMITKNNDIKYLQNKFNDITKQFYVKYKIKTNSLKLAISNTKEEYWVEYYCSVCR